MYNTLYINSLKWVIIRYGISSMNSPLWISALCITIILMGFLENRED